MPFKASLKEIDNGFLVDLNPKVLEYQEVYVSTFPKAIALVVSKYIESHPQEAQKESSKEAINFSKVSGLIAKDYLEFKEAFEKSFPGENILKALDLAHCQLVDGKVVFVGG